MIELPFSASEAPASRFLVVGLGSAGGNMLDRLVLASLPGTELLAVNTDAQALSGSVAPQKIQIGAARTRGLGAGGDPELGAAAAEEALDEIGVSLEGAGTVVILAGLGGGTGSGALPILAAEARARGALTVAIVTLPFGFEGNRRRLQALETLAMLEGQTDLLLCFENDRMHELVSARSGAQEAFGAVEIALADAVRTLAGVARSRGLLHAGLAEICSAFAGEGLRALLGSAEVAGDNRAHEAVEQALRGPLLSHGRNLREAHSAVIQLTGGTDLTLHEVETALEEVRKHLPAEVHLYTGLAVEPALEDRLRVTILASTYTEVVAEEEAAPAAPARKPQVQPKAQATPRTLPRTAPAAGRRTPVAPATPAHEDPLEISVELPAAARQERGAVEDFADHEELLEDETSAPEAIAPEPELLSAPPVVVHPRMRPLFAPVEPRRPVVPPAPAAPAPIAPEPEPEPEAELEEEVDAESEMELEPEAELEPEPQPAPAPAPKAGKPGKPERQEQMLFEAPQRGRFEKSEPTIVDGENLDIPTFMRRNMNP